MNGFRSWIGVAGVLAGLLLTVTVSAQDITGFENGYLTFDNTDTNLYYRLEFHPNLTGSEEWTADLPVNIQSSDPQVTVPVGVFYRVASSGTPFEDSSATYNTAVPKTGQTNSFFSRDDGDLKKGVAWPNPRFTVQANTNLVVDNMTGLMWTRNANLGGARNWTNALIYCNNINEGSGLYGHTDWRLPNVYEIQSLIDYGRSLPSLPSGHPFTGIPAAPYYWSSSTVSFWTAKAWGVSFVGGGVSYDDKTATGYVWPVCGGGQ